MPDTLTKKYRLVLADPPWNFLNWSADSPGMIHDRARGANKHYPTDTLEAICQLVPPTDKDAILLLWTISSHLEDSFEVIRAWGFKYKAIAWVWEKTTKDGSRPRMGMGYYTRQCTELCLVATKGHPPGVATRAELGLIKTPRLPRHSAKPAEQYEKIDRLWPDLYPRLEMFARGEPREGWDHYGNEASNSISIGPMIMTGVSNHAYSQTVE